MVTVEALAAIVKPADAGLAAAMLEHPVVIDLILHDEDVEVRGWRSETRAEVTAHTVSWVQDSARGPRPYGVTVIETTIGGRVDGEGWAEEAHYVSRGILTPDEARTLASLALSGMLPTRTSWKEI